MSKTWIFLSSLGGTAAAVGGYFAYSYWNPEAIAKRKQELQIKKFKEMVREYENKQSPAKVYSYLKEKVCVGVEEHQETKDWCNSISDKNSVIELIQGLTRVNKNWKPYEEMVAEVSGLVPLENN